MKKIAIITLVGNKNFGNKLQNYALQEILKERKFEVETLNNTFRDKNKNNFYERIRKITLRKVINKLKKKKVCLNQRLEKDRLIKFEEFTKNNIRMSNFDLSKNNLSELEKMFDFFAIGSDQIWNPNLATPFYINLATFAPKRKKIAYAPSFGINKIPNIYKKIYFQGLNDIEFLSVREDAGANIVKQFTKREIPVLIDPTMLLTADRWRELYKKQCKTLYEDKYIFMYFLGGLNKKKIKLIENYALKNNLKIINILDFENKEIYKSGPLEFIQYIDNAELVLTDSFHGCVFSILLHKEFFVFSREKNSTNMNSRIETLLNKFKLKDRMIKKVSEITKIKINERQIEETLEEEKEKSNNFINKSLYGEKI